MILVSSLALAGCCGRTLSVARPRAVKCPVVFVQSEAEPQVIAMTFVSMTRHVHVDSLLYLSGRDVLPKFKLYDYNGRPPFRDSWCKIVKGGHGFLNDIEQRCKMEVPELERDDRAVWVTFYRSDMIPKSYPVSVEFYESLVADLRTSIDDNASIGDCQGIEFPVECRWFDDIKCLGTDVTAVPDMSVLLSDNGTGFSPAYVFYRREVNKPVKCSDWAFFRLWTRSVKLKEGITMDEFRKEVEAKMSECAKLFDSDFHWEFRLVCWDSVTNKLD